MKRLFFFAIVLTCCAPLQAVGDDHRSKANQLLEIAAKCQGAQRDLEDSGTVIETYRSLGDEHSMHLVVYQHVAEPGEITANGTVLSTKEEQFDEVTIFFANYTELMRPVETDNRTIRLACRDGGSCISQRDAIDLSCSLSESGERVCPGMESSGQSYSASELDLWSVCEQQKKSIMLALRTLIDEAAPPDLSSPTYRVVGVKSTLNVRSEPNTKSPVIADMPVRSGYFVASVCVPGSGTSTEWCEVHWGGVNGWVARSKLQAR